MAALALFQGFPEYEFPPFDFFQSFIIRFGNDSLTKTRNPLVNTELGGMSDYEIHFFIFEYSATEGNMQNKFFCTS
jgi:hypothetical protein